MVFTKICPRCKCVQHVRRAACAKCPYVFRKSSKTNESEDKCELRRVSDREGKARKRANETCEEAEKRRAFYRQQVAAKRANVTKLETSKRRAYDRKCKQAKIAGETETELAKRRLSNRQCTAAKRAKETEPEATKRRLSNRQCTASKRASETEPESAKRRLSNRQCTASKRANENEIESAKRRAKNKKLMAKSRTEIKSIENIIDNYLAKVKVGPDYVCTCCHRMMYKHTVSVFRPTKYSKATPELLQQLAHHSYVTDDGKQWVCKCCDVSLSKGVLPVQAKANGMGLGNQPPELSCLNPLEQRLISLHVPFMKMVALPCGKQRCIHGPAVNVPSRIDCVCTMLPRLPSECELVPLKLKRKLSYKGHALPV